MYSIFARNIFLFSMTLTTLSFRKHVEFKYIIHYPLFIISPLKINLSFNYDSQDTLKLFTTVRMGLNDLRVSRQP